MLGVDVGDYKAFLAQPPGHLLGTSGERGPDQAPHRFGQALRQPRHQAPVDNPQTTVVEYQEISRVRVSVQQTGPVRA